MRLLKVGRDSSCDIVLHSDKASALHAEITILNNGDILLEDKGSRNGTFIMNRPIKPGTQVSIKRGDAIRFADVELVWSQIPMSEDLSMYKAVYGIGTSMRNDIQIVGNTVSRYHATLKIDRKDKAYLQDHSKNGSTVNGERLNNGQTRQVRRGDSIVCGGVPVNLSQFIPSNGLSKMIRVAVAVAVIVVCCWGIWQYVPFLWSPAVTPVTTQALENASACVYGGFYFEANIKDDPFKEKYSDWPEKWTFGFDRNWNLVNKEFNVVCKTLSQYSGEVQPYPYTGTAFFISTNGEMGTNRHIVVPWEYEKAKFEDEIRNFIMAIKSKFAARLAIGSSQSLEEAQARINRMSNSDIEVGGSLAYFGVGLTGNKINSAFDLQQAQVIAESGDDNKDVALIRLNSRQTPERLIKMGAIYDIEHARIDENSLKPQDEDLTIIGYPKGETIGTSLFNGSELRPTIHKASLSKRPDDNQMQIQAVGIGGQSGSPVIDKSHRLVGVLCSGFYGTEVTYCCNIKHLVELYNKHRVRE